MTDPLLTISVVIPTHRRGSSVHRAVSSVRAQTSPVDEILVVANGVISADEVQDQVGAGVVIVREPRAGAGFARNAGLRAATSDICAFLDSDDEWDTNYLAHLRRAAAAAPDAVLYAGGALVHQSGRAVTVRHPRRRQLAPESLVRRNGITTSSAAVRRDAAIKLGGFTEGLELAAGCEDLGLWLQLAKTGRAVPIASGFCVRDETTTRPRTAGDERFYRDLDQVLAAAAAPPTPVSLRVIEAAVLAHRASVALEFRDRSAVGLARRAVRRDPRNLYAWVWLIRGLAGNRFGHRGTGSSAHPP